VRLVSREQALKIDQISQERFGISGRDLMEDAGQKMAKYILKDPRTKKGVAVFCGPGNNGGDAKVIARVLRKKGIQVAEYEAPFANLPTDARAAVIIDGIFGVGLTRNVEDPYLKAINWINRSEGFVYSVDLPSGLDANSGSVRGIAVKADVTLTVWPGKVGLYLREGPPLSGRIVPIRIIFPEKAVATIARDFFLMEDRHAKSWWPQRPASANKSTFGHAYVLAGSKGKWGAAVLALRAAFRAGAGYVVHCSADSSEVLSEVPEAMHISIDDLLREVANKKNRAVGIGPGAGFSEKIKKILTDLQKSDVPVLVDADALSVIKEMKIKIPSHWILTPHSGELSRLLGWSAAEVDKNPIAAVQLARKKWGGTIVLKGLYTLVLSGYSGRMVIVPRGNVSLAKAGTGDVLSGLITGLLAQGLHPLKACLLGIYLHGSAADDWVKTNSSAAFSATDLINCLPRVMKELESNG